VPGKPCERALHVASLAYTCTHHLPALLALTTEERREGRRGEEKGGEQRREGSAKDLHGKHPHANAGRDPQHRAQISKPHEKEGDFFSKVFADVFDGLLVCVHVSCHVLYVSTCLQINPLRLLPMGGMQYVLNMQYVGNACSTPLLHLRCAAGAPRASMQSSALLCFCVP